MLFERETDEKERSLEGTQCPTMRRPTRPRGGKEAAAETVVAAAAAAGRATEGSSAVGGEGGTSPALRSVSAVELRPCTLQICESSAMPCCKLLADLEKWPREPRPG